MSVGDTITESLCGSCEGICCRAGHEVAVPLTPKEVEFLTTNGTKLKGLLTHLIPSWEEYAPNLEDYPRLHDNLKEQILGNIEEWLANPTLRRLAEFVLDQPRDTRMYRWESDCAYLDTSVQPPICGVYDDPSRPAICDAFPAGGANCLSMREGAGIPLPVSVAIRSNPRTV